MSPSPASVAVSSTPPNESADAMLEKLGTVAVEMGRSALRHALMWAGLGLMLGLLGDLVHLAVSRVTSDGPSALAMAIHVGYWVACPLGSAVLLASYGAQRGALRAGFVHEPEVGVLGYLARRGISVAEAELGQEHPVRGRAAQAARAAGRIVLGVRPPRWTGLFGAVARVAFGTLAHVYERALTDALVDARGGSDEPTVAARAHAGLVDGLRRLAEGLLAIELTLIMTCVLGASVAFAPLAVRIVRMLPW